NPGTTIEFTLPSAERTVVRVFDALGRSVAVLFDGRLEAGSHQVQWVGRDAAGLESPAGVYFVRIEAGQHSTTHKMALVR
ncbi:MAG TPA: FlgD immunoglobulin-like domain containing protein, partial [bacterium]